MNGGPEPDAPILRIEGLEKRFGGVAALHAIDYEVPGGIIQALIGPNGAGKTTLFNCISGVLKPSNGIISLEGRRIEGLAPHRIAEYGSFEDFSACGPFQNDDSARKCYARQGTQGPGAAFLPPGSGFPECVPRKSESGKKPLNTSIWSALPEIAGLDAGTLPIGKQKILEIARALATEPRLILLDEPAGGLNMRETEELGDLIQQIKDLGVTVLLVEHDMNLIMDISDRIMVLNYGEVLACGTPAEIKENSAVIEAYLGVEDGTSVISRKRPEGEPGY